MVRQQDYANRLEQRRVKDQKIDTMNQYQAANKRITANHHSDVRIEAKRWKHRINQQQEEIAAIEKIEREAEEKAHREILREQDEQLSAAIFDMKSQKLAEETNARRICEESEELKELKEKLRAAKISKVRATQLEERELIERQNLTQDRAMDMMMENDRRAAADREADEAQRKYIVGMQSRSVLQNQIAERQTKKKEAYEAFLREKAMVDDIVQGIEEEDKAKMLAQRVKQEELKGNIRAYLEDRESWRQEEKKREEDELKKVQEYNAKQAKRHEEMMVKKKAVADAQVEVLRKLTREIEAKKREEETMRMLLDELYQEEAEQKALKRVQADAAKRERMKQEILEANQAQKELKKQRAIEMQNEEARFREQMLEKFANDKRLEEMNSQRRRREMQGYKAEVERLVEERRLMYQAAVEAEEREMAKRGEQEEYRMAVVERERQRLLREHADDLKDYLPKGVLKDQRDYEVVYGSAPKKDYGSEELNFIRDRNKRSTINLGGMQGRVRDEMRKKKEAAAAAGAEGSRGGSRRSSRPASGGRPDWLGGN